MIAKIRPLCEATRHHRPPDNAAGDRHDPAAAERDFRRHHCRLVSAGGMGMDAHGRDALAPAARRAVGAVRFGAVAVVDLCRRYGGLDHDRCRLRLVVLRVRMAQAFFLWRCTDTREHRHQVAGRRARHPAGMDGDDAAPPRPGLATQLGSVCVDACVGSGFVCLPGRPPNRGPSRTWPGCATCPALPSPASSTRPSARHPCSNSPTGG